MKFSFPKPKSILHIFIIILLSGCGTQKQYLKRLPKINKAIAYKAKQSNISIYAKQMSENEAIDYFRTNLYSYGYTPVHLRIENNSDSTYILRPGDIDQDITSVKKISKCLHRNTALFFSCAFIPAFLFYWQLIPVVLVPTAVWMAKKNRQINQNLAKISLTREQTLEILPYSKIDKFLFFNSEEYSARFMLNLYDKDQRVLKDFYLNLAGTV